MFGYCEFFVLIISGLVDVDSDQLGWVLIS